MSDILTHLYNACDPFLPASKAQYVDCAAARGESALTHTCLNHLKRAQRGEAEAGQKTTHLRFLLAGHIGGGKSSELMDLKRALENPTPLPGMVRYFTIYFDAHEYLDEFDADTSDLLLAIVAETASALRNYGKELKDSYFEKRIHEIWSFLKSDVEVEKGEINLGMAKAEIKLLKADPEARRLVREHLQPKMSSMLEEINLLLSRARLTATEIAVSLGEAPFGDIVLILDNLERIRRMEGKAEGLQSQRELFIERAPQLTQLSTHMICTLPLGLARSDNQQLKQRYGCDPMVLPMVKVAQRGTHEPYQLGIDFLRQLLKLRLPGHSLEQVFKPEALKFLLEYSGGHVRNLMLFVREACTQTQQAPIPLEAAHRAITATVRGYSTGIPEAHWEKLVRLDASEDQQIPADDPDYLRMLENLSVLEYINGDGAEDPFSSVIPWYAVNPIVRELPKFKSTARRLEAQNG